MDNESIYYLAEYHWNINFRFIGEIKFCFHQNGNEMNSDEKLLWTTRLKSKLIWNWSDKYWNGDRFDEVRNSISIQSVCCNTKTLLKSIDRWQLQLFIPPLDATNDRNFEWFCEIWILEILFIAQIPANCKRFNHYSDFLKISNNLFR